MMSASPPFFFSHVRRKRESITLGTTRSSCVTYAERNSLTSCESLREQDLSKWVSRSCSLSSVWFKWSINLTDFYRIPAKLKPFLSSFERTQYPHGAYDLIWIYTNLNLFPIAEVCVVTWPPGHGSFDPASDPLQEDIRFAGPRLLPLLHTFAPSTIFDYFQWPKGINKSIWVWVDQSSFALIFLIKDSRKIPLWWGCLLIRPLWVLLLFEYIAEGILARRLQRSLGDISDSIKYIYSESASTGVQLVHLFVRPSVATQTSHSVL